MGLSRSRRVVQAAGVTGLGGLSICSSGLSLWWEDIQAEVQPVTGPLVWYLTRVGLSFPTQTRARSQRLSQQQRVMSLEGARIVGRNRLNGGNRLCQVLGSTQGSEVPEDTSSGDKR